MDCGIKKSLPPLLLPWSLPLIFFTPHFSVLAHHTFGHLFLRFGDGGGIVVLEFQLRPNITNKGDNDINILLGNLIIE